jgi:hypothetical protein
MNKHKDNSRRDRLRWKDIVEEYSSKHGKMDGDKRLVEQV